MNIRDLLVTEHGAPGRHRTPAMEHGFPKCPLIFQNALRANFGPVPSHGAFTMTGLAVVRINSLAPLEATPVSGPIAAGSCVSGSDFPSSLSSGGR